MGLALVGEHGRRRDVPKRSPFGKPERLATSERFAGGPVASAYGDSAIVASSVNAKRDLLYAPCSDSKTALSVARKRLRTSTATRTRTSPPTTAMRHRMGLARPASVNRDLSHRAERHFEARHAGDL